ncbi:hypothetical protein JTE90_010704 [Oedothorax gibbosus]|uniref:Uncharacterized protein n=1 Tax=Oedothorax gibbosus TaxID=931172 RepID=A0AAV6UN96_9ARAC|nr:hypothetical protein JTE90_010704 [Oedothorax gibbosus]
MTMQWHTKCYNITNKESPSAVIIDFSFVTIWQLQLKKQLHRTHRTRGSAEFLGHQPSYVLNKYVRG